MIIGLTPAFSAYLIGYSLACAIAAVWMVHERGSLLLFRADYRRYLSSPWKLVTFAAAATAMTIMAPYTGDPTWDYVDAAFMSILTFLTAPWAVATLFLALKGQARTSHVYVVLAEH